MFASVITMFSIARDAHFNHAQITHYRANREDRQKEICSNGGRDGLKILVIYLYVSYHSIAQCIHCTVGFSCSQKSPVVTTGESPLLTGNNRGYFVVTTGEYFRKKHNFRFWDSRKSNFQAHWDKYMSNNMTVSRSGAMSRRVRSKGEKTVQCTHCTLERLAVLKRH